MSTSGKHKKANSLINETSPYLLQHAYNPVDWLPYSPEAFEKADRENKPVLISIGYSACHWCHVMERESFEDEQVASLMNEHFINVKVDREERSDVDMFYMQAVNLMTGHGGWPLNCFALPDGKPFYGGTYFPRQQWLHILTTLAGLYRNDPEKVRKYAHELSNGIVQTEQMVSRKKEGSIPDRDLLRNSVAKWKKRLDNREGGPDKAPKFPMPNNYLFLLRFALLERDDELLRHVYLTLRKMAQGGIYDQVRGGFCRYSTDTLWKVPHFEKMLYDNAQLISLYSEAFLHTGNDLYRQVVHQTLSFIKEEWYLPEGCFFSSLDADSEGVEGKYYVWTKAELREWLKEDFDVFARYFEINEKGYWEDENYILMRRNEMSDLVDGPGQDTLLATVNRCLEVLRKVADGRVKPGLDDKTITSWNAMMCSGYAKAYLVFGNEEYRQMALSSVNFIRTRLIAADGKLWRTYKNETARINGFLEDYAFVVEALYNVYLITQDLSYLEEAKTLLDRTMDLFDNPDSEFLFYTDHHSGDLVTRITDTQDNVIPSANSQVAFMLFILGKLFDDEVCSQRAERMLSGMQEEIRNHGSAYSNWALLALHFAYPGREIVIVGKNVDELFPALYKHGLTNAIFGLSQRSSDLPLFRDRYSEDQTWIYVCENRTCQLPVSTIEEALAQLV